MRFATITILQILLWTVLVAALFTSLEWWIRPPVERGNFQSLQEYLTGQLKDAEKNRRIGSAALILLHKGAITEVQLYEGSREDEIGSVKPEEKLYLLCSVSKAVTAWGIMKLVEDGKIGLNDPILPYLKRWRFPGSEQFRDSVTISQLLSHTSGLVERFGYSGFSLEEERQTPEESLQLPKDANMGEPHPAIIQYPPGSGMSYSSAGYTVLQILIEELTGKSFNEFMKEQVLQPLGMKHATYDVEELVAQNRLWQLVPNYDSELGIHPPRKHTMMAGGSLYITPHEMALFLQAYFHEGFLPKTAIEQMLKPQPGTSESWALGHEIYVNDQTAFIAGHGGGAFPRTGASFRVNSSTGNAIAIMMTGGTEMIDPFMKTWTYWETGLYDFDIREVVHNRGKQTLIVTILGALVVAGWRIRKRKMKNSMSKIN